MLSTEEHILEMTDLEGMHMYEVRSLKRLGCVMFLLTEIVNQNMYYSIVRQQIYIYI